MNAHFFIIILLISMISSPVSAQKQNIKFEHLSLGEGLSQSTVYAIRQDSQGFMWFGTQDGLNKYDGYQFTVYRHEPSDANSLSYNEIFSIYEDSRGTLWIGTGDGLNQFERQQERFIHYFHDPKNPDSLSHNKVWSIYEDNTGILWIGTGGGGLNQFDRQQKKFVAFRHDPNNPNTLSHDSVWPIFQDKTGTLWIGTDGGGLNKFDREQNKFVRYWPNVQNPDSFSNIITSIYEDHTDTLWIGTLDGFYQFDRQRESFVRYSADPKKPDTLLSHNKVWAISEDSLGTLWIATDGGGLNQFERQTGRFVHYQHEPQNPTSLNDDDVLSLYQDRAGTLWVGTGGGGINHFNREREKFVHYFHDPKNPNSLNNNHILSFYEDRAGILWVGTQGGGLNKFDLERQKVTHYLHDPQNPQSLSHNDVSSIYEDSTETLWVGTFGGGLNQFNREQNRFVSYLHHPDKADSLSSNYVLSIHEDSTKTLWIGTREGINQFDRQQGKFVHYVHDPENPDSLSHNTVSAIYEDKTKTLWVGTQEGGLNQFDHQSGQFVRYQHGKQNPTSLSHNDVSAIYEDKTGTLWVSTFGGGLNKFDRVTKRFYTYREKDGLANDMIYGILEETQGHLWLSSNKGLSQFNPKTEIFRHYDVLDGLQSNEFNSAYHKSRRGEFFFGGINGFNAFYPERVKDNPYIPPIVITNFSLFNKTVSPGKTSPLQQRIGTTQEITLSYKQSFFSFEFAALNFLQSTKNQYAYQLEGFDKDWNEIGTRRNAYYTNVPHGTYVFRVKGSNNDTVWNHKGTAIKITILPPPWKTWWAYMLYVITILTIIVSYVLAQKRKLREKQQELEREKLTQKRKLREKQQELEREKEIAAQLKEADRLKNEFLANTSHELRTPLNGIIGIAESLIEGAAGPLTQPLHANLAMIVGSGRRLFNLVNDILDFSQLKKKEIDLQLKTVDTRTIAEVVLALSQPLPSHKKVQLVNAIPAELPPINADESRVQQILYNLVGNAIKFTDQGTVTVSAKVVEETEKTNSSQNSDSVHHSPFTIHHSPLKKWLAITVSDTGIGIPEKKLDRIFEAFEQADGSASRIYGGTGLGLAVTQQLVKLHGGQMRVQSQVGVGSQFTFTLPIISEQLSVISDQLPSQSSFIGSQLPETLTTCQSSVIGSPLPETPTTCQSSIISYPLPEPDSLNTDNRSLISEKEFTLLIVDDESVNRQVLVNYLSLQPYCLRQAASGAETLALLEKDSKPDLILLDVMMPLMNGYEVTQIIRKTWPADELPIILLTAKNQITDLVVGLESGANDYLTKPVYKDELLARIKTHLNIQQLKAETLRLARKNENRLRQFLEAMPAGVCVLDATGKPYYVNQKTQQIFGKGVVKEASATQIAEVYQIYVTGTNQLYPSENLPVVRALQGESVTADDMDIHQADKIIPVEAWGTPIFDDNGNIVYALTVFQDITERKQAEEKLWISQFSVEHAAEAIFWIGPQAQILYANEAALRALGYPRQELYTMTVHDIDPHFPVAVWPAHWEDLKQCGCRTFESQHQTKEGELFPVEITVNYMVLNGTEYNFAFVRDLSERKQVEEERTRYIKELGELNTTLTKMNVAYERFVPREFLSLLDKQNILEVKLGDQVAKEITVMFSDIREFTAISETMTPKEVFDFINGYLGQMEPVILEHHGIIDKYIGDAIMALFPTSADDAVHGAIAMLKKLTKYNQFLQSVDLKPMQIGIGLNTGPLMLGTVGGQHRMEGTVIADAVNVASRVEGLTKIYGTPLLITEKTYLKLADPLQYHVRVIDAVKVKGKSEEVTVYEIFDAEPPEILALKDQTRDDFEEGFVLYHWEEYQDAQPLFERVLQINKNDQAAQVYLERCQKKSSLTMPLSPRILIVDDMPDNAYVLSYFLTKNNLQVSTVKSGKEALQVIQHDRPHLILLDVMMPGMDGFETCQRLQATSQTRHIPVIFMTALSDTVDKVKAFEVGAVDYITKPFESKEVLARIKTHLRLSHLQQKVRTKDI